MIFPFFFFPGRSGPFHLRDKTRLRLPNKVPPAGLLQDQEFPGPPGFHSHSLSGSGDPCQFLLASGSQGITLLSWSLWASEAWAANERLCLTLPFLIVCGFTFPGPLSDGFNGRTAWTNSPSSLTESEFLSIREPLLSIVLPFRAMCTCWDRGVSLCVNAVV